MKDQDLRVRKMPFKMHHFRYFLGMFLAFFLMNAAVGQSYLIPPNAAIQYVSDNVH